MNSRTSGSNNEMVAAMTVAGSDSGGGAGIQADLLTFAALGVYGTTALTCLTAQNPEGVRSIEAMPASFVRDQMEQIIEFFPVSAVKTGMLFNTDIIETVADFIRAHPEISVVVDPVMVATSGALLLHNDSIACLSERLLPAATLITPNLDEAAVLCGWKPQTENDMSHATDELAGKFGTSVLIKGGHLECETVIDVFQSADGASEVFRNKRIPAINTHGSGCTLSSAIAAFLANDLPIEEAIHAAIAYLRNTLTHPASVGGDNFISHLAFMQMMDTEKK